MTPTNTDPIKSIVEAAKAAAAKGEHDELERVRRVLGLEHFAAGAKARADLIASRASEIDGILKAHSIDAGDEATILAGRPGLQIWFDDLRAKLDDLRGQTFNTQSTLQRALVRYARLSPADLVPLPGQLLVPTAFGMLSSEICALRSDLANIRPAGDIDEAIARLKFAHAALLERLQAVAA
jgi:hypothetical protein